MSQYVRVKGRRVKKHERILDFLNSLFKTDLLNAGGTGLAAEAASSKMAKSSNKVCLSDNKQNDFFLDGGIVSS